MDRVIIIGAGPAGLTAANELLKLKKYEVIVLEETESIGGISKTVNYKGNKMDMGGHRFFSKNEDIVKYWNEILGIQGKPAYDDKKLKIDKSLAAEGKNPEKEDDVMLIRRRVSRILYSKRFFDYPISITKETLKNMGLITTIKVMISYLKVNIFRKKEKNLEDFYVNRFGKTLYEIFFKTYTEKLWGRKPVEISAEFGAQRVKGISIKEIIKNIVNKKLNIKSKNVQISLIEEFLYPKYGAGQLWEALACEIEKQGGIILKNHKVKKINITNEKVKSVTCIIDDVEQDIEGDIFISSMPLKDFVQGINGVNVPEDIKQIAKGLPYRDFITIGVLAKKLKLKNTTNIKTIGEIVPDCWIYVQEAGVKIGRIQIFNNWSPYIVKDVENTVWLGLEYFVQENDKYWNMPEKEFIDFAINELEQIGIIDKIDVIDAHQEKVKKAYPAYFDTYSRIEELKTYLNGIRNLYCIGRNGQHRYNNMDHSMLTAIEAVKNIENHIDDKSNIWNINIENEYHETKLKGK